MYMPLLGDIIKKAGLKCWKAFDGMSMCIIVSFVEQLKSVCDGLLVIHG